MAGTGKEVATPAAAPKGSSRCGHPTRRGGSCRLPLPCRLHARADAGPWSASADVPVTPPEAMRLLMNVSWLRWQLYADMLRLQVAAASARAASQPRNGTVPGSSGLVGHKLAYDKDNRALATGEEIRALTALEGDERDRCARLVKLAHDMGVEDMGDWAP